MAGLLNRIREMSDEAEQAKIARRKESAVTPDLLSGSVKMIAGGLGAVPTAVGRAIEQIPTGVGKLIGGVPINPPDYAVNQPLDLAVQGAKEFGTGLSDVGTALRSKTMNVFGLKEAPVVTAPARPFAGGVPKPVGVGRTFEPEVAPVVGKKTREQFTKDIEATRVEPTAVPVPAGRGIAGRITMGGPEGENVIEVPRPIPELGVAKSERDYDAELDALINKLMEPQYNTQGKRLTKTQEFGMASTLKQEQVKGKYGLRGHEITAGASKLATKQIADENRAERKRAAEERIRMDVKELEQRRSAGEDTRLLRERMDKEDNFQKALTKYGEDPIMGFNAGKGLFEMGFQSMHADRPEVQQAYLPFKARLEKALGGKKPTPQQLKMAKEAWYTQMGWAM